MKLFDLHCDTLTECVNRGVSLKDNTVLHLSVNRLRRYERCVQTFAVFIPDWVRGQAAFDYYCRCRDYYLSQVELCFLKPVTDAGSLSAPDPLKSILSVEGGAVLAGKMENLEQLYRDGVRMLTLTWNGPCELGEGSGRPGAAGLTDFGRHVVERMEKLDMVVDVSHLSDAGFEEVCGLIGAPFVASHSNARAVCAHSRNLTDRQAAEIIRRGGLIGLNFYHAFIHKKHGDAAALAEHALHILGLGGEKALAVGSDFDGCEVDPSLLGREGIETLSETLLRKNVCEDLVRRILYQNAANFFARVFEMV